MFCMTELIIHRARCGSLHGRQLRGRGVGAAGLRRILKPDSELRIGFQCCGSSGAGGLLARSPNSACLPPGTTAGGGGRPA